MRKSLAIALIGLLCFVCSAYAHHPTEDIVDAEIYTIIDAMVSDTPHADLVFDDDMGGGSTLTTITSSLRSAEELIDDGLITEVSELSGDVYIAIEFADQGNEVIMTISQVPE